MFNFWSSDEEYRAVEKEFRRLKAKYERAKRKYIKYHIRGDSYNYNANVRAIVEQRAAEEELKPVLEHFNMMRQHRGMRPALVYGINAWR